ncbi:MAG: pyridoxal phosphate-dependent aminotransferase [Planctomycetota bacterium]|nr:MAG: pyridoxal phosphate-dependent aminotransferase [Planctomycetota bacterium]
MRFPPIAYLEFAKRRLDLEPPRYNLASSGMQPPDWSDLGLERCTELPLSAPTPFGYGPLRERLAARYGLEPAQLLTTSGTSLANFLVCAALIEPGDDVALEWPRYEPLEAVLRGLGARIHRLPRPAETGFQPDLERCDALLQRGLRLLVLTDLHNPSAAQLDEELRVALIERCARHGSWLLLDEVYLDGVFDRPVTSAAGRGERVVVTSSLTKTWGLGALRVGWAVGPASLVRRMAEIHDHLGVEPPSVTEAIACRALERLETLTARARRRRAACLPLVRAFAERHGLRWHEPAGGFIAWLGLPDGRAARPLSERLRRAFDTQITPGDFFGVPDHVRLGFGAPPEHVSAGLERFGRALS